MPVSYKCRKCGKTIYAYTGNEKSTLGLLSPLEVAAWYGWTCPFCGSGTFLVRAFHRKIEEGETLEKAYEELVGFDVNPLAVAVARAELIIAYRRVTDKNPSTPPRIYHTDTLAVWYGKRFPTLEDPEYERIMDLAGGLHQGN